MSKKSLAELEMFGIDYKTVYAKSANGQMTFPGTPEFDEKLYKNTPQTKKDDENTL